MPINTPASVSVITVHGTHLTIGAAVQTQLRALGAADEIFDISYVRRAVGNNITAFITYEAAP